MVRQSTSTDVMVDGTALALLVQGPDQRAALLALIEGARHSLALYYYIFAADASGTMVREALIDACNRGVSVTLLVDAFGSATTPAAFFAPLIDAGARFGRFGWRRSTRYLIRNHQKMAIADGTRAIIGGFNVEDRYFAAAEDPMGWRDLGLWMDGPHVGALARWYADLAEWTCNSPQRFRDLRHMVRHWQPGEGALQWLMGGPTRHLNRWAKRAKDDFAQGWRLDMAAAYFSPGPAMLRRLRRIARRGAARILLARRSDNMATVGAARHLYRPLLGDGVAVHEYLPNLLHMKLIVIDDLVYVGSANFDKRSLFLNVEVQLRVDDPVFAAAARAVLDAAFGQSQRIGEREYRAMAGPVARLRWWISYLLVGMLDYTVARRLNFRSERS